MSTAVTHPSAATWGWGRRGLFGLTCLLFGHEVDNGRFSGRTGTRECRCGRRILSVDRAETRVRHTLSCFLGGHTYVPVGERHGHREYVCDPCGHPLLFPLDDDPYAEQSRFMKRVRYACGLFGHRVHKVSDRSGRSEFACRCGHSFLVDTHDTALVRHPPICVLAGHFLRFVERRGDYDEYRCRNCGHTFCFTGER